MIFLLTDITIAFHVCGNYHCFSFFFFILASVFWVVYIEQECKHSLIIQTQDDGTIFLWKIKCFTMSFLLISLLPTIKPWFGVATSCATLGNFNLVELTSPRNKARALLSLVTGCLSRKSALKKFRRRTTEGPLENILIWKWDVLCRDEESKEIGKITQQGPMAGKRPKRIWNPKHLNLLIWEVGGVPNTNHKNREVGGILESLIFYLPQSPPKQYT